MYLDGSDYGPGVTGEGLSDALPGRYVIQQNPVTNGVGGFIEKSDQFSSYYADKFGYIANPTMWDSAPFDSPTLSPWYGQALPNIANSDESIDIGVGIHFSLGQITQATTRDSFVIFASDIPGGEITPVPYLGPVVTNDPETAQSGSTVTYTGSDLDEVTSATIAGHTALIVSKSARSLTLRVPAGLTQGMHDVVLHYSTTESITLQNGLVIQDLMKVWTQLQSDNTVKMYAKNIIGEGKIQFFHNNNEIAWVKASNALNPKLRQSNGSSYLVRTRELVAGKNAFEIYQDGKRIWRAAYSN